MHNTCAANANANAHTLSPCIRFARSTRSTRSTYRAYLARGDVKWPGNSTPPGLAGLTSSAMDNKDERSDRLKNPPTGKAAVLLLGAPSVHGGSKSANAALGDAFNTKTKTNAAADHARDARGDKDHYFWNGEDKDEYEDEAFYRPANPQSGIGDDEDEVVYPSAKPRDPADSNEDEVIYRGAAADVACADVADGE